MDTLSRSKQGVVTATISKNIPTNVRPPTIIFNPPEPDSRLNNTLQLACCLELLRPSYELDDILHPTARNWLLLYKNEQDERDRLKALATNVIRAFKRDEFKDSKAVTEIVYLAPVLENEGFRYLLKEFYSGIDQSGLLDVHQLEGIAHLIQDSGCISCTDAMADANVSGVGREKIYEPLSSYLNGLKSSSDPYLVYQAAYAYQALLCVPDDEPLWQASFRRVGKVIQGVSGLVSAVKGIDLNGFVDGLKNIQQGLAGVSEIAQIVKNSYEGATSLAQGGQGFFACLQEGFSFNCKCAWYSALRGADILIQDGKLAEFRKVVCEEPCRRDAAFQWGVCQRLGEVAANSMWDTEMRHNATEFLIEIYQNDIVWDHHAIVKQWILSILMQLSSLPGDVTKLRVWDTETGGCLHILIGHDVGVYSVMYSPEGGQITSGSMDGSLKVWDLERRMCLWTLAGHNHMINRIVYSPRGDLVVSASDDESVRLWDVASGRCRAVIQDCGGTVNDIIWIEASGVNYLIAGCSDKFVRVWQVEVDDGQCHITLSWMTTKDELNVQDTVIEGAQELSRLNERLLKQRGAVVEPVPHPSPVTNE
ncbi:MAG: hypothetical protein J3Q66DRAFT_428685 [Benniella sp.]|nr:MAG: hypothetical protein J3Q66DRAFT_428685 [Benniella sp.]